MDNNKYTDEQLKKALAKMLPDQIVMHPCGELRWWPKRDGGINGPQVLDTELLHLCSLVEQDIPHDVLASYHIDAVACLYKNVFRFMSQEDKIGAALKLPWQQRTIALAKVKGVEIV